MDWRRRGLFNHIVANSRMEEPKRRRFFQQIMSGIEYSHRLKIVHRDLKPENMLLDGDLNVKIGNFGLSNKISDGDFLTTSCGSPNYAAPEVIRGEGNFHLPSYLSSEAKGLITSMLVVDPLKCITVPEIIKHSFVTTHLPRYLTPLPPPPGPVLRTLSALVGPPKQLDFTMIDGLGKIEE
ncbi:kinase-like protein, partial [Agrocybe pediades]